MDAGIARRGSPTLDDLAALNREMAALVGAGLPLEPGLKSIAADYGGRPGRLAGRLAERAAAGMSLQDSIAAEGEALPTAYRAVVDAGLRSGRLSAALEGFAETAARISEMRRLTAQAAVYPLIVLCLAWIVTVGVLSQVLPAYEVLNLQDRLWAPSLELPGGQVALLAFGPPAVLLIGAMVWWRRTGRVSNTQSSSPFIRWIPGVRKATQLSAYANFADLLATLLRSAIPMTEALPLAARASGDVRVAAPAVEIAQRLADGASIASQLPALRRLPPLVRTALLNSADETEEAVSRGLQRAAAAYRERAAVWVADFAVLFPVILTIVIGIGVIGFYAVTLMQPYFALLRELLSWS
jgi:general secretion pathway protein F